MTVVYRECKSNHVRHDHRTARPGSNYPLIARVVSRFNFLLQMGIDEWTFFQRPCHFFLPIQFHEPTRSVAPQLCEDHDSGPACTHLRFLSFAYRAPAC